MAHYDTIPRIIIVPATPSTAKQLKNKINSLPSAIFSLSFGTLLIRSLMIITLLHVLHTAHLPQIRAQDIFGERATDETADMFSGLASRLSSI
jgi:hypothetical protein